IVPGPVTNLWFMSCPTVIIDHSPCLKLSSSNLRPSNELMVHATGRALPEHVGFVKLLLILCWADIAKLARHTQG
ncbi:MAG: hypothetical protein NZM29_05895, partial [Nitrospira sp.]|nr:hypothetical protein [Nitrospira sp.]